MQVFCCLYHTWESFYVTTKKSEKSMYHKVQVTHILLYACNTPIFKQSDGGCEIKAKWGEKCHGDKQLESQSLYTEGRVNYAHIKNFSFYTTVTQARKWFEQGAFLSIHIIHDHFILTNTTLYLVRIKAWHKIHYWQLFNF